jgi:hypothetical protein
MVIETTRPGPARRRTPLNITIVDDDSVEETGEEDSDEELHRTKGGIMLCCDVSQVLRTDTDSLRTDTDSLPAHQGRRGAEASRHAGLHAGGSAGGRGADQVQQQVLQG